MTTQEVITRLSSCRGTEGQPLVCANTLGHSDRGTTDATAREQGPRQRKNGGWRPLVAQNSVRRIRRGRYQQTGRCEGTTRCEGENKKPNIEIQVTQLMLLCPQWWFSVETVFLPQHL